MWKLRYQAAASPQNHSKHVSSLANNLTDRTGKSDEQQIYCIHRGDGGCDSPQHKAGNMKFHSPHPRAQEHSIVYFTYIPKGSLQRRRNILSTWERTEDIPYRGFIFGDKRSMLKRYICLPTTYIVHSLILADKAIGRLSSFFRQQKYMTSWERREQKTWQSLAPVFWSIEDVLKSINVFWWHMIMIGICERTKPSSFSGYVFG